MATLISDANVVLIDWMAAGGARVNTYRNRLEMVLSVIDNGALGEGGYGHGSPEHLEAVQAVLKQAAAVLKGIRIANAREAAEATRSEPDEG